jgi:hypothetical protein
MFPLDRARDWDRYWFGFWGPTDDEPSNPSIRDFIDPKWRPSDKNRMIEYLVNCPVAVASCAGYSNCLLCSERAEIGCFQSDGTWLWPADLAHFVSEHSVVLPQRFVEHMRNRAFNPPAKLDLPIEDLPWPA